MMRRSIDDQLKQIESLETENKDFKDKNKELQKENGDLMYENQKAIEMECNYTILEKKCNTLELEYDKLRKKHPLECAAVLRDLLQ